MRLAAAALGTIFLATSACIDVIGSDYAKYVERETKHFSTTGPPDIALSTFDGAIEIRAWDKPDIEVVIERHAPSREMAQAMAVDAQQTGNRVSVDVKLPEARGFGIHLGSRSAKLIVSVPAQANLTAKSGDGAILVDRVTGRLELRSGDGSIRARSVGGEIRAHTGDGSIRLDDVKGAVDVDTGDGSIVASGALSSVRARSGDGSVTVHADTVTPAGDWDISTGDGSVALDIPADFNGDLDAHTGGGRVHLENVTVSNVTGTMNKETVRGQIGSGGRSVKVRSGDGSIRITSRFAHE